MTTGARYRYRGFLERTTENLRAAAERVAYAEGTAHAPGVLQVLDARVKVVGLFSLVLAATLATTLTGILVIFGFALLMVALSRLPVRGLLARVWVGALLFSGAIALPALVLTPGEVVARVPGLPWGVTAQGARAALYLVLRVETATTLVALLVFTTPWARVLRALRSLRVPVLVVVVFGMTYRYILLLLEIAHQMFESRRSRMVGTLAARERRRLAAATAGVLMGRTLQLGNDVYLAMQARGFRGDVYVLDQARMRPRDYAALAAFGVLTAGALWMGR